jgi:hypothetical protein
VDPKRYRQQGQYSPEIEPLYCFVNTFTIKPANAEVEDKPEKSSKGVLGIFVWSLAVVFVIYILCTGPFFMMIERSLLSNPAVARATVSIYQPEFWAYKKTLLHKPLGMYWHLWAPSVFDIKGNTI